MTTGSPEQYRSVADLACAAAYVDGEGGILVSNGAFHALLAAGGMDDGAIEGHVLPMLFVERDREAVRNILSAPRARPASRATSVAGVLAPMVAEFEPIRRKSHQDILWLVTLHSSKQALELPRDLAFRTALTTGIVHDLRAPVQVVLGWASLLRRKHDDPRRIEHALGIIESNAETLMYLLEDLLEQTRPSWMRAPLRRQEVDLVELVRSVVRSVQPLADQAGLRVSFMMDAPVVAVEGNEVHLRRVVANLVANALKFTPPGGLVECRVWISPAWAGIEVRDNGRGIDSEFLPRVFEAFGQGPAEPMQGGNGLGLGLHVVRQLVELHGGTVTAASQGNGRGATFTVLLPVVLDHAIAGSASRAYSGSS